MKSPPCEFAPPLLILTLCMSAPLNAQRSTQTTSQPTSAPAAECPIRPLITATLTSHSPRPFDYEMTPLGTTPITVTITAPPVIQPDDSVRLIDMAFETRALNGELIRVPQDYRGKIVVVHFWASWCPACVYELPHWVAAQRTFKDRGVAFVGIPVDRNRALSLEAVRTKAAQAGMTWPQSFVDAPTLSLKFQIKSLPAVFIVEGDTGRVLSQGKSIRGENLARELEALVKRLRPSPSEPGKSLSNSMMKPPAIAPAHPPDPLVEIKAVKKTGTP